MSIDLSVPIKSRDEAIFWVFPGRGLGGREGGRGTGGGVKSLFYDDTCSKLSIQRWQLVLDKGFIFWLAVSETSLQADETPTPRPPSRGCRGCVVAHAAGPVQAGCGSVRVRAKRGVRGDGLARRGERCWHNARLRLYVGGKERHMAVRSNLANAGFDGRGWGHNPCVDECTDFVYMVML